MPEYSTFLLFGVAAAALVFTPGPNTLFIIARSVEGGRKIGVVSSLGVETGTMLHVTAAALGLSVLLASSAIAFSVVRYAGATYLILLGVKTLLGRKEETYIHSAAQSYTLRRVFLQAILVNLLNPKSALFFLAFLPQFIDPHRSAAPQMFALGTVVVILGLASGLLYSSVAGTLGHSFSHHSTFLRSQRYVAGSVYIGLGLTTAFAGGRKI